MSKGVAGLPRRIVAEASATRATSDEQLLKTQDLACFAPFTGRIRDDGAALPRPGRRPACCQGGGRARGASRWSTRISPHWLRHAQASHAIDGGGFLVCTQFSAEVTSTHGGT
jgi:hypothetical protein